MAKPSEWRVRRRDQLPRYISWEQYERNQRQLQQNSNTQGIGAIRHGPSLLSGLVRCGRCGRRMVALYNNNGRTLRYECNQLAATYGEERCQSLIGRVLDAFVTTQVLAALAPAALEISLQVAEEVEAERARQHQLWQQPLARAHYQTERAARQYHAVEPENRLVACTLERDWEEALRAEAELKADYDRFAAARSDRLCDTEREQIRRLASDLPALWHAATTTAADRCSVIRQLIESVTVTVRGDTELVDVRLRWIDGQETQATITRPVAREDQLSYFPQLRERVAALVAQGHGGSAIARLLNAEGWRPPKRRQTFNAGMVQAFMVRQSLRSREHGMAAAVEPQADEWTIGNLAHELDMPSATLYAWLRRGLLTARRVSVRNHPLLLVHATMDDLARLRVHRHGNQAWRCRSNIACLGGYMTGRSNWPSSGSSRCCMGHLKKTDPQGAKAWLQGKLLVGGPDRKTDRHRRAFSPWGYVWNGVPGAAMPLAQDGNDALPALLSRALSPALSLLESLRHWDRTCTALREAPRKRRYQRERLEEILR